jgi:hypothetical protein
MTTDKKEIEGKLIIDDLTDNAHRVRRNLLIFSFVAIFYKLSGAAIDKNGVSFYGINFNHIDENFISIGIFLIVFYHLFHFLVIVIGHWQYLRIRVTKSDVKFLTAAFFSAECDDHPSNPKDSSLYAWYSENISRLNNEFDNSHQKIEELLAIYKKEMIKQQASFSEVQKCSAYLSGIDSTLKNLVAPRIFSSLGRFDKSLKCYRAVELFRWILIEILIPLIAGIVALGLLYFKY